MEQSHQSTKGKENHSLDDDQFDTQPYDPSLLQLLDLKSGKRMKPKTKYQKAAVSSIRPGDWVCLICNNLNFSFRNECNRCQMQTKRQNYMESLRLFSETRNLENDRLPLKDLTNQNLSPTYSEVQEFHKKSKSSPLSDTDLDINLLAAPPGLDTRSQGSLDSLTTDLDHHSNTGFESVILLTPPKINKAREKANPKEYLGSEFLPYKSPQKLPSVSPILKNMLKEDLYKKKGTSVIMQEGYAFNKAFVLISEVFCGEEEDLKEYNNGSGDETADSANAGRKLSTDEQEEAEDTEVDMFTENILQDLQLSFIDEYPKVEELPKPPKKVVYMIETSCDKKTYEENPKKSKKERKSDWICVNCGNLNYSFRKFCNRCQIIR